MAQHSRNLVAVVVVATAAMLADRAAAAVPVGPGHVAEAAGRLVDRLADRFCRTVAPATTRFVRPTVRARTSNIAQVAPVVAAREPTHRPSLPFQFRLPPPPPC